MPRPVWFLDVDGVLLPWERPHPRHRLARTHVGGLEFRYSRSVVDAINDLSRTGAVEVRWLTSWGESAATDLAPALGLDQFAVEADPSLDVYVDASWEGHGASPWKVFSIARFVAANPGVPVVWTDDDMSARDRARVRALLAGTPGVLLRPHHNPGLRMVDLKRIEAFLPVAVAL